MIKFNMTPVLGTEIEFIKELLEKNRSLCGDGYYSRLCEKWFVNKFDFNKTLMTPSCTSALEMAAILLNIQAGDEIIVPSYTFVSSANAFVLRGAKIKFVDIRKDTLNINEDLIEAAITEKTKAIVVVHYAGVSCNMEKIMKIATQNNLYVVEDAAQAVMSKYKGKYLGGLGHLGTFSFHETKNYTSGGEGGLLVINDPNLVERADILREKGTNRSQFYKGMVDKYTWVDIGSSFLPSDIQCAYLYAQLLEASKINNNRLKTWSLYKKTLEKLNCEKMILPSIPDDCEHNAHMFQIIIESSLLRDELISFLREKGIQSVFHYVPLHSSVAGKKFGEFIGEDRYTTSLSSRLIRLPLWYGISEAEVLKVCDAVRSFFDIRC